VPTNYKKWNFVEHINSIEGVCAECWEVLKMLRFLLSGEFCVVVCLCSDAFDQRCGVGILRIKDGLDCGIVKPIAAGGRPCIHCFQHYYFTTSNYPCTVKSSVNMYKAGRLWHRTCSKHVPQTYVRFALLFSFKCWNIPYSVSSNVFYITRGISMYAVQQRLNLDWNSFYWIWILVFSLLTTLCCYCSFLVSVLHIIIKCNIWKTCYQYIAFLFCEALFFSVILNQTA